MASELKPCPFCGKTPIVEFGNGIKKYWISCNNPKCRVQPTTDAHIKKSVITREWNRRFDNG